MNKPKKLICIFFLSLNTICSLAQSFPPLPVASISEEAEIEGFTIVHTVTLSVTNTTDVSYNFNSNVIYNTVDANDINYFVIESSVHFTGPLLQTIIVPAGVSSFTISTFTNDDYIEENDEFYTIRINNISATGTILDGDTNTTTISSVTDDTVTEGGDLVHMVQMSNNISGSKNFSIEIVDISTNALDYDDILFSDGITYDFSTGILKFPQTSDGITNFTITIPTIDDLLIEEDESFNLIVAGRSSTGTIIDNDTVIISSVSDATETEGTDLVHTIRLSNTNPEIKSFTFSLIDNTTDATDYDLPIFGNGVTFDSASSLITVPAGIDNFTITIPTIDDVFDENDEFYDLYVEDISAIGTILDNDTYTMPKYFTPNNDGIRDTWPYDLVENNYILNNAIIYIFDRYGKLLKEVSSSSNGWDGTYNGKEMPVDDYWYQTILQDGKVLIGHFTLKR